MRRLVRIVVAAASAASIVTLVGRAQVAPACDPDNGGLKLPPGFCAAVVAQDLGRARHLAVAANGDLFVSTQAGRGGGGGIVALRDTDGDGKFDKRETFGSGSTTGVRLRNGYVYWATTNSIVRQKLPAGELKPTGEPEVIAEGLTDRRQHADKGLAFDEKGGVYVNIGAPSNVCQNPDRQPKVPGQDPCPLLDVAGGVWRFDENKLGQKQADGKRYATGMRQLPGLTWYDGSLWVAMHNRDGLKLVTNPEYGGDGHKSDRCGAFTPPTIALPAHWAPNDLMFYTGSQFPTHYKGGVFVAFHGSWNRAPLPMAGYNITFVPFSGGKPGKYEVFADGFAGKTPIMTPNEASARPGGLAQAPDGSLYITEDTKGKVWRVMYKK